YDERKDARGYDQRYKQRKTRHGAYNAICDEWIQQQSQREQLPDSATGTQVIQETNAGIIAMMPPRFTQQQYEQNQAPAANESVNMTGNSKALVVNDSLPKWIIDTGAINHMAVDIELLNKDTIAKADNPKK
ncbi:hypothetical protein HAX54_043360, partial [Datura stramonium]|nr:hypothetical protein [Datura stramonium]